MNYIIFNNIFIITSQLVIENTPFLILNNTLY